MQQTSLEIDITSNSSATGIWSDGTTIWVADTLYTRLYAYQLSNGTRQPSLDIDISDVTNPVGIWSDGSTIWVTDTLDGAQKILAYNLADGARIADSDFNTLRAAGVAYPRGLWGDQYNLWVADVTKDKVYAFKIPRSENVNLTGITVDSTAIPSFIPSEADGAAYEHGVAPGRTQVTVAATQQHAEASVSITPSDASSRSGHQVNLSSGANPVTITVTAEDRITTAAYTLNINRGVTGAYGWQAEHDLDGLKTTGNDNPQAIWTDGETIWVLDYNDTYVYAYDRVGNRVNDKWIDLHADNDKPTGIWSDETTMWVSDRTDKKLYAYTLAGSSRDTGKEFNLDTSQGRPLNIWSDGDTIWVVDFNIRKLFAYVLDGGARLAEKDIDVIDTLVSDGPIGLWSNEITLWITQNTSATLFAYRLDDGSRDTTRDFTTLTAAGNSTPASLTGDAGILWAMDAPKKKAFAYNVPGYVPNRPATGAPRISDTTPLVDQVLTVDLGRIRDRNGLADVVYSYQWMTTDGTTDTPIAGATGDTFTVTDAQAGSQLKVTVNFRDHDGHRESLSSAATAPVPTPELPGAPRSLQAGESDETLRLTWRAPSFNGNAVITSYIVEYKLSAATTWLTATRPTDPITLTQEIAGLTNDSPYDFRVAAVNSAGPGAWATGTGMPNPFYRAPDEPQEVSAASGDESMTVTWNTPAHNGNGRITGYNVEYRLDGQTAWQKVTSRSAASTTRRQAITGLENKKNYDVRVAAVNEYGTGDWAQARGGTQNIPGQVTNVRASAQNGALNILWDPPERDGGLPLTYVVSYFQLGHVEDEATVNRSRRESTRQQLIEDLTNGQDYRIRVTAVNRLGHGGGHIFTAQPGGCGQVNRADGYWKISWLDSENDRSITSRNFHLDTLEYCLNNELPTDGHLYQRQLCRDNTCHYPHSWIPEEQYLDLSREFCVPTTDGCSARGNLTAALAAMEDLPQDRIDLVLSAVFMENQEYPNHATLAPEPFREHTVDSLKNHEPYVMFTRCDGGVCDSSRAVRGRDLKNEVDRASPPPPEPEPPGPARNVSGSLDEAILTVSWRPPSSRGSSSITGYNAQYRCEMDTREPWINGELGSSARSYRKNLDSYLDSTYCRASTEETATLNVRVAAVNDAGTGDWAASTVTVPAVETPEDEESNAINPQPDDGPVTASPVNGDTETRVSFTDPEETKCENYYIEAWGSVGHIFRVPNASNGSGSRDLPLKPVNNARSSDEINYVSVHCGTLSEDRGRFKVVDGQPTWGLTVTPENPDNPGSDTARHVGTVQWRSD